MVSVNLTAVEVYALLRSVENLIDDVEAGSEDYLKRNLRMLEALKQAQNKLMDAGSGGMLSSKSGD